MARVLIVKTSSMGDVIHTMPAITDAGRLLGGLSFDWVVEEGFREIPLLHPLVHRVIPVAVRRWRKRIVGTLTGGEFSAFKEALRRDAPYDLVIDAQGLLKSALITRLARSPSCGFDRGSVRERLASLFYEKRHSVPRGQHAVERVRQLFAAALGYEAPREPPDYGIVADRALLHGEVARHVERPAILLIHGSSWESKRWSLEYWERLARALIAEGFRVLVPWDDEMQKQDAEWIAFRKEEAFVLPRLTLSEVAAVTSGVAGVVCGDTGLGHLAVALGKPTVALYGPTSPELTGLHGRTGGNLASDQLSCIPCLSRRCRLLDRHYAGTPYPPCFEPLTPELVMAALHSRMAALRNATSAPPEGSE